MRRCAVSLLRQFYDEERDPFPFVKCGSMPESTMFIELFPMVGGDHNHGVVVGPVALHPLDEGRELVLRR